MGHGSPLATQVARRSLMAPMLLAGCAPPPEPFAFVERLESHGRLVIDGAYTLQ